MGRKEKPQVGCPFQPWEGSHSLSPENLGLWSPTSRLSKGTSSEAGDLSSKAPTPRGLCVDPHA